MKKSLKVLCSLIIASIIALSSCQNCLAWCSFDGPLGKIAGISDDLHEDITEIAFKMLLKYDYNKMGSLTKKDVDYVLPLLRQGACWNDLQTDNISSFVYHYRRRDKINPYKYKKYNTIYDICDHANQNMNSLSSDDRYSVAIKFSHNNKASFLHSMLNFNPDDTVCSQLQTKQFIMQWLQFTYQYSLSPKETTSQQNQLMVFVDANKELTVPGLQIRTLGMACHTIQDAYNPAHTSRSYYDGRIKAFLNYEIQDNHSKYDAISSADHDARKKLLNSDDLTLRGMDYIINNLKTPGLKESIIQTYEFLKKFNSNTKWNEIEQWLNNEVFSTNFDEKGNAKIMEGGRYCQKIILKDCWSYDVKNKIKDCDAMSQNDILVIKNALDSYYECLEEEEDLFYPISDKYKYLNCQNRSLKQMQIIIDSLYDKCSFFSLLSIDKEYHMKLYDLLLTCNQLIQDYCMDLGPEYNQTARQYQSKTTSMINKLKL